jgi:hypothetical protein
MIRCLILLLGIATLTACEKKRTSERHLIPANYEGVVIAIYGQAGFPKLPMKDGYQVFEYPKDGILITSSQPEFGWAPDETLDVLPDGTYRQISSGNVADRRMHFGSFGSEKVGGVLKLAYAFRVIGSVKYWESIDATEYDRKIKEAKEKLAKLRTDNSEQGVAPNDR